MSHLAGVPLRGGGADRDGPGVLPARLASLDNVVANKAGMLLGAVLFLAISPMLRHG